VLSALLRGSDNAPADPETKRADCHNHETKIPPAILVRYKPECRAHPGNKDYQPIQPSKKRDKADNCQNKGDEPEKKRNDISHRQTVAGFSRGSKSPPFSVSPFLDLRIKNLPVTAKGPWGQSSVRPLAALLGREIDHSNYRCI